MSPEIALLQACCQYLDKFYLQGSEQPNDKVLLIAEQLAAQLIKLSQANSSLILALLAMPPKTQAVASQLALKQASFLLYFNQHAKWPSSVCIQLLCAQLLNLRANAGLYQKLSSQEPLSEDEKRNLQDPWSPSFRLYGKPLKLTWLEQLYRGCSRQVFNRPLWQSSVFATALITCYQLAISTLPRQQKTGQSLEQAIRQLCATGLDPQQRAFLHRMSAQDRNFWQVGRFVQDELGEIGLIITTAPKLMACMLDVAQKKLVISPVELAEHPLKLLAPRACQDWQWYEAFNALTTTEHESQQPRLSISVLNQLNTAHSIGKQVNWFHQHPELIEFVLQVASKYTREQRCVNDIRHALAILGTEQLPSVVRQAWLENQIQQCHQPHQAWFGQFQQVFKSAITLIAQHSSAIKCHEHTAALLSLCFSLQLQLDDQSRFLPLMQPIPAEQSVQPNQSAQTLSAQTLSVQTQNLIWHAAEFLRQLSTSLANLGLNRQWQDAVLSLRHQPEADQSYNQQQPYAMLLQFAVHLAERCFLASDDLKNAAEIARGNATHALDLPEKPLELWVDAVLADSECYWPIYGNL